MNDLVNRPSLGTTTKSITLAISETNEIPSQRTIVVLGVERGGTSMIAGVLRAMGVCMGERAGLNHEDPRFLTDDQNKLKTHISQRNQSKDIWGFKMPKASLSLDFFDKELRNPIYIVAYRNPLSVADSWAQRGAGDPMDVLERIDKYQGALNELYRKTTNAVLLVNYERTLLSPDAREKFVDQLARFIGLELDEQNRQRSINMMTGDGGGYVNLPEHYFLVTEEASKEVSGPMSVTEQAPDPRSKDGWVEHEKLAPKLIYKMTDGNNFPKRFRLKIDIDADETTNVLGGNLRLCFRYTDKFIAAHCARPNLHQGLNVLDIETSGLADAVAFMPLKNPCKFKMKTTFELLDETIETVPSDPKDTISLSSVSHMQQTGKGRLRRFIAKWR